MAKQAKILGSKEIENVFKILETDRDKLIFALGLYTSMRIGEIIRLKQNQVFTDQGIKNVLTVQRLKKRRDVFDEIPVHPKLRLHLKQYRNIVRECEWLFPSSESIAGHIIRERAHQILSNAFDTLKIEGASTHSMRRTALTNMSRSGVPLRIIQKISGHANLGQLQEYLEVDPEDKHKAINVLKY
jgi:integrase/recombinase XerD